MTALCSICGDRPATAVDLLEGYSGIVRRRPVCDPCVAPVAEPAYYEPAAGFCVPGSVGGGHRTATRDAVLSAVRCRGEADTATIRVAVGAESERQQNALTSTLRRLVARGVLAAMDLDPRHPSVGKVYRAIQSGRAVARAA